VTPLDVVGVLVTAGLTVWLVLSLRSRELRKAYMALRVLKGWKWVPALAGAALVVALVVVTGFVLTTAWPAGFGWSWLSLLARPQDGPEPGRNLMAEGLRIPGFAYLFVALLLLNVPRLAKNEERAFRQGVRGWRTAAFESLKFGMAHCLVGVPIGFGLALALAGAWFAWQYSKGGLRRSTAYHALHNWILLGVAGLWLLWPR
jgi:hypothetical protein